MVVDRAASRGKANNEPSRWPSSLSDLTSKPLILLNWYIESDRLLGSGDELRRHQPSAAIAVLSRF